MRTRALVFVASLGCFAVACGGVEDHPTSASSSTSTSGSATGGAGGAGGASPGGGGSGGAGGFETAKHQPFPTVSAFGGPVLAHPNIVTVTFAGYEHEAEVQAFDTWIATSDWLTTTGADYGVAVGAHLTSVVLAEAAPATATDDDSSTLLVARIQDGTLPDPATLENPYYVLYYPNSTMVTDFNGDPSCVGTTVGGYHWESAWLGTRFAYGVLPTCSTDPDKAIGYIESSSGHELIEASTDPFPETATGWVFYDPQSPWSALPGEVGDLCEFESGVVYGDFQVPRVWSNSAATAGVDPCIPAAKGQPLYDVTAAPTMVPTVQPGASQTFELTGWSTEDIAAWKLEAVAWGYGFTPTVSLEKDTIKNGETVKATLTVPADAPGQSQGQAMIYSIRDLAAGEYNQWPITVRTP